MGGASERYGVMPDLMTVGKAMANGYSIAAVVGKREVMSVYVKDAFLSSTFFPNSLEMVAAMKCIDILEREKVQDAIWERGTRFLDTLGEIVDKSGVPVTKSGIPPMPFLTFDHVDDKYKERRDGVLHAVHPPRPVRAAVPPLVHLLPPHGGTT